MSIRTNFRPSINFLTKKLIFCLWCVNISYFIHKKLWISIKTSYSSFNHLSFFFLFFMFMNCLIKSSVIISMLILRPLTIDNTNFMTCMAYVFPNNCLCIIVELETHWHFLFCSKHQISWHFYFSTLLYL